MLEECPKWQALVGVLEEIDGEIQQMESCDTLQDPIDCRVLVCAQDDRTCHQLKEVCLAVNLSFLWAFSVCVSVGSVLACVVYWSELMG